MVVIKLKDNEVTNIKIYDDDLDNNAILRFSQTLENYSKVSVGNDTYNLTKYKKIQITDTTVINFANSGGYLLQNWVIKCNDRKIVGKIHNFVRSTIKNSPTGNSGATNLPPIGDRFMYAESSSNNHGIIIFVSFERTEIIQNSNTHF